MIYSFGILYNNRPVHRHWYHSRESEFKTSTTIKITGDCWHESDGPDSINGLAETLVVQKDGTQKAGKKLINYSMDFLQVGKLKCPLLTAPLVLTLACLPTNMVFNGW